MALQPDPPEVPDRLRRVGAGGAGRRLGEQIRRLSRRLRAGAHRAGPEGVQLAQTAVSPAVKSARDCVSSGSIAATSCARLRSTCLVGLRSLRAPLGLLIVVAQSALCWGDAWASTPANRPNILLFVVDDMGWRDWERSAAWNPPGSVVHETPNMIRLAA